MLADSPGSTWSIADLLAQSLRPCEMTGRMELVKRFAETEVAADFKLIQLLERGIAVHHAGLLPELRFLIEWLTEEGDVRILIATTTLAQGVNFPVSSIVLATHYLYQPYRGNVEMSPAAFRNLIGRAGRLFQDTLAIVASRRRATGAMVGRITTGAEAATDVRERRTSDRAAGRPAAIPPPEGRG